MSLRCYQLSTFRLFILTTLVFAFGLVFGETNPVFASSYSASLSTSGPVSIDILSSHDGANLKANNVTVVSTCPNGYDLSISGPSDGTLYLNGDSNSTNKINASSGTRENPLPILGDDGNNNSYLNTWGYTTGSNITVNSNFIGLTNELTPLVSKNSASAEGGDTIPVYYGASINAGATPGIYKMAESEQGANDNVITYTLTPNLSCISYLVEFNPTSTSTGSSLSGTGTMDDQRIYEGVTTGLTPNDFTAPSGYEFKEWNTAQDGTGTSYTDGQQVTDITTPGQTITLYAIWREPCGARNICYDSNGADNSSAMGNQPTGSSTSNPITLWPSNYQRAGYGFAGWNTSADGSGTSYGPNQTISDTFTIFNAVTNGLQLYATWVEPARDTNDDILTFQTPNLLTTTLSDESNLNSKSVGYVTALKDQRDGQIYAVAKLADGNYWMIENLRLETAGTVGDNTYDSSITNASLAQGYGTSASYGNFAGLADPETSNFSNSLTANSLYSRTNMSGRVNIGTNNNPQYRFPRYNNINTSNPVTTMNNLSNSNNVYSYGNYYTWPAAVASTDYYSSSGNGAVTNTSICPKGWHLPYGTNSNTSGGFYNLNYAINNNTSSTSSVMMRTYPNNFIYSGNYSDSSASDRTTVGGYWSSAWGLDMSYLLELSDSTISPGTGTSVRYKGYSIRCVINS